MRERLHLLQSALQQGGADRALVRDTGCQPRDS